MNFYFLVERYRIEVNSRIPPEVQDVSTEQPSVEIEISPPEVPPRPKDKKKTTPPVSFTFKIFYISIFHNL